MPLGQVALNPLHRDAVLLGREVEAPVDGTHPGGHVCPAGVEQRRPVHA